MSAEKSKSLDATVSRNQIELQELIKAAFPAPKADIEDSKNEEVQNSVEELDNHSSNACLPFKVCN